MIKLCALFVLAFGVGMSSGVAADAADASAPQWSTPERQLLVMLHLPAPHYRPDASYSGRYSDDTGRSARHRIADNLAQAHGLKLVSDWPMPVLGVDCYVMEQTGKLPLGGIIDILSHDPRVEWVQPMGQFQAMENRDPLYPLQPSAKLWHLSEVHKLVTGKNVLVALVDSGVEENHPDLTGQVMLTENFVDGKSHAPEAHGTAVAGIIAARAGNGAGIEGVAPGARLMALRACWETPDHATLCNSFTLGKALNFAIMHRAQIINLSLGGPPDRLLQRLLDVALRQGVKVVAAIDPQIDGGGFPASHPGVMAVTDAASKNEAEAAKQAGAGFLVAPGHDIPTTAPGARWVFVSGSSYAAAHVTGMVALLSELRPTLQASQVRKEMVVDSVDSAGAPTIGTIDVCATIAQASGTCPCSCTKAYALKAVHHP